MHSDSDSGDSVRGKVAGAVRGLRSIKRRLKYSPKKVVRRFRRQVKASLGAEDGRTWQYADYWKRISWQGLWDLRRVYWILAEVMGLMDRDEMDRGHAMIAQTMIALEQVAINRGNWEAAWPLLGVEDPLGRRMFAGDERDMERVASYLTEMSSLRVRLDGQRGQQPAKPKHGADDQETPADDAEDGGRGKGKKKGGRGRE